jgi:hypothetical protein
MSVNTAIQYTEYGWYLVEIPGIVEPDVCACWKGRDCGTPGKHPKETAWQVAATNDEEVVASWFESGKPVNIGLLLGPKSGVIDVELDGDEAIAAWNRLDLGEVYTPTYTSGRGPHRLFKWTDDLPRITLKKPMGIEIRLGADGAVQSVLPPSRHWSGSYYEWVEGLSPSDVELAPLPDKLKALLWNDDGVTPMRRAAKKTLLHRKVEEGERNNELHRYAVREAFRSQRIDDPTEQQDLQMKIRAMNQFSLKPPLSDNECVSIFRSVVAYVRKSRAAATPPEHAIERYRSDEESAGKKKTQQSAEPLKSWQQVFTDTGLAYWPQEDGWDSEWQNGQWSLTVVHSDPLEYRLHVPAWCACTANGTGDISLSVDQYRSAARVAAAVLAATGTVMLDDEPGKWKKIWDGGETVAEGRDDDNRPVRTHKSRGIKAKLLDNVMHEYPGASSQRYVALATWMYDRLSQASQPNDEDIPDSTGRPSWRKDGTLWFSWSKVWEDIERSHRVQEGDRLSTKRRLLGHLNQTDFKHSEYRHAGGTRKSYVVWSQAEFAVLESLAATSQQGS